MDLDQPYRGGFAGREHHFALTVYFEDTDTAGIDQRAAMEANEGVYAVAEVNIRYLRPARLGDDLVVVSTVEQVRAASVLIHQQVMRGAEPLADARVTAAFLSSDDRPKRQPKAWVERFNQSREGHVI